MKSQQVRLIDVFLLGPFMIWAGATQRQLPPWAKALLVVSGAATVVYNARNYLLVEAEEETI
jgi:hypothetical protein